MTLKKKAKIEQAVAVPTVAQGGEKRNERSRERERKKKQRKSERRARLSPDNLKISSAAEANYARTKCRLLAKKKKMFSLFLSLLQKAF